MHENCFGRMLTSRFEQVMRPDSVHVKVVKRTFRRQIMTRLCSRVNKHIGLNLVHKLQHVGAVLITRASSHSIDTNIWWAASVAGHPVLSVYFVPYYAVGILALFAHLAAVAALRRKTALALAKSSAAGRKQVLLVEGGPGEPDRPASSQERDLPRWSDGRHAHARHVAPARWGRPPGGRGHARRILTRRSIFAPAPGPHMKRDEVGCDGPVLVSERSWRSGASFRSPRQAAGAQRPAPSPGSGPPGRSIEGYPPAARPPWRAPGRNPR